MGHDYNHNIVEDADGDIRIEDMDTITKSNVSIGNIEIEENEKHIPQSTNNVDCVDCVVENNYNHVP